MAKGLLLASLFLLCAQLLVQAQQDATKDPNIVQNGTNLFVFTHKIERKLVNIDCLNIWQPVTDFSFSGRA